MSDELSDGVKGKDLVRNIVLIEIYTDCNESLPVVLTSY